MRLKQRLHAYKVAAPMANSGGKLEATTDSTYLILHNST